MKMNKINMTTNLLMRYQNINEQNKHYLNTLFVTITSLSSTLRTLL